MISFFQKQNVEDSRLIASETSCRDTFCRQLPEKQSATICRQIC